MAQQKDHDYREPTTDTRYREPKVTETSGGGGNNMMMYIGIAIAALVALLIVLWLLGVFSGGT